MASGIVWNLAASDTASISARQINTDTSDFVFKLGDNATDGGDRFIFWQESWLGVTMHRWPLVMNGIFAAFDPRFT